jgi:uncharacterized protein
MNKIFKKDKNLIGMIHTPDLCNTPVEECISKCLTDMQTLEKAGFDAILIENHDDEIQLEFAIPLQIEKMTAIAKVIGEKTSLPFGVQMMLNDWKASFDICKLSGASFTRLDVFVDNMLCDCGEIFPKTLDLMKYKEQIYPELVLYTDIHVKHKEMLDKDKSLLQSASEAIEVGSDGLVITGEWTGKETSLNDLKDIKSCYPEIPVLVGSGVSVLNINNQKKYGDLFIVGTSIKSENFVDYEKSVELIKRLE